MEPVLFMGIENVDDLSDSKEDAAAPDSSCIKNPNRDDNRRLFQVRDVDLQWDPSIPYDQQPNRLFVLFVIF